MTPNILKFNPNNKKELSTATLAALTVLKKGGFVIHPTDTCYGIAADMRNERAIKRVYQFKGRDFEKPFFIIVRNITQFKEYGTWNKLARKMIDENPKKMFTFVVSRKKTVPGYLNPGFKTIGIQIPRCLFSQILLKEMKKPVIGTSANLSGQQVIYSIKDLLKQLNNSKVCPDLILDAGEVPIKRPSSVIRIKGKGIEVLRK